MNPYGPWFRLTIEAPEQHCDALCDILYELGISSIEIQDATTMPSTLDPCPPTPQHVRLVSYFEESDPLLESSPFLQQLLTPFAATFALVPYADTSWRDGWKAFFKPAQVSPRLAIRPPWEPFSKEGVTVLIIEPGMAFGTGLHETTRLCLQGIDRWTVSPPTSMLDVGCGSGVLAIAAARLGTPHVVGIDNDPIAVEVSHDNAAVNSVTPQCDFNTHPLEQLTESFPLIAANILASVLHIMRDALIARLAPHGILLLSGVLSREAADLEAHFCAAPHIQSLGIEYLGEWSLITLQRTAE